MPPAPPHPSPEDSEEGSAQADEYIRVALRLRQAGRSVIGLLPASPTLQIREVAVRVGAALADLIAAPVALVEAKAPEGAASNRRVLGAAEGFSVVSLGPSLMSVSRSRARREVARAPELRAMIRVSRQRCQMVIVDLYGFHMDESVLELVDWVVVIARSHFTSDSELRYLRKELPDDRVLGLVLAETARS
jgi:hypothetical protein